MKRGLYGIILFLSLVLCFSGLSLFLTFAYSISSHVTAVHVHDPLASFPNLSHKIHSPPNSNPKPNAFIFCPFSQAKPSSQLHLSPSMLTTSIFQYPSQLLLSPCIITHPPSSCLHLTILFKSFIIPSNRFLSHPLLITHFSH